MCTPCFSVSRARLFLLRVAHTRKETSSPVVEIVKLRCVAPRTPLPTLLHDLYKQGLIHN